MTCFECGESTETFPWFAPAAEAADIELCEVCHPKCVVPGCGGLMLMGGEGGCAEHEPTTLAQQGGSPNALHV